jgi:hypothetical protein
MNETNRQMLPQRQPVELQHKRTLWPESESELYRSSDRRLSSKSMPTFVNRGCHVVSVTDPYGSILGFLDPNCYFFFQVAPQLYEAEWTRFPLLGKSGSAGNRTRTSGFLARNSDRQTTEVVYFLLHNIYMFSSYLTGNNTSP